MIRSGLRKKSINMIIYFLVEALSIEERLIAGLETSISAMHYAEKVYKWKYSKYTSVEVWSINKNSFSVSWFLLSQISILKTEIY